MWFRASSWRVAAMVTGSRRLTLSSVQPAKALGASGFWRPFPGAPTEGLVESTCATQSMQATSGRARPLRPIGTTLHASMSVEDAGPTAMRRPP